MSSFIAQETTPLSAQQEAICKQSNGGFNSTVLLEVPTSSTHTIEKITSTWQTVAENHPVLRTRIVTSSDGVYSSEVQTDATPVERATTRRSAIDGAFLEITSDEEETSVTLHVSQALVDKTSLALISREFCICFDGCASEPATSLEAYRKHIFQKDSSAATKYWQEHSQQTGKPSALYSFPRSYESPRVETVAVSTTTLPSSISQFTQTYDVRIHDLIYAAWAITADRHTHNGQGNACFVIEGRDKSFPNVDKVIGFVDQKFPLMVSIPADTSVLDWIKRVGGESAEASKNAFVGYQKILESADVTQPQIKFSITTDDKENDVMTDDDDEFSLVIDVTIGKQIKTSFRHNASVPAGDAQAVLKHFLSAIESMINNPEADVTQIEIASAEETNFIMQAGKAAFKPQQGLLHQLFEQQVQQTPDRDAIQFESNKPLSYTAVNARANQLARQLTKYKGTIVPVSMRTTPALIFALLAILKAGAAYVAMDPDAPIERNRLILETCEANHVLVDSDTAGRFENETNVEDLLEISEHEEGFNLDLAIDPSDNAYIIFTSGSTGKPKAAVLDHKAAFNGLKAFPKAPERRQLLFFNPVFSAAQRSIWAPLCMGAVLCLASKENLTVHTAKMIAMMNIDSIEMTATTASLITPESTPTLKRLALGGEMVSPALVEMWGQKVELLSSYGLSECTQINVRKRLEKASQARFLGQAFDTTTTYLLTPETDNLAPLLIPGELCFGGSQLAKGYLGNPEVTEKKFVKNPFGSGKIYRTGDLALRHADGSVEMVGRIDFQVKINGQKVDPAEANVIIQAHQQVEHSAVVASTVGKKTVLVAMVVTHSGSNWDGVVEELRAAIGTKLPAYMIPSFWVSVPALPLNLNQKVDVGAIKKQVEALAASGQLLPPGPRREANEDEYSDNEKIIRNIWADFLSIDEANILREDSFLELGGTSLEAVQVASRLHSEHGLTLLVEDIILGTSLIEVASKVQTGGKDSADADAEIPPFKLLSEGFNIEDIGIKPSDVEDAFPVTPFQEGVITNTIMGGTDFIYRRAYSFKGHSAANVKKAFQTLMKTTPLLRTTFAADGMEFLQVVRKTASLPWKIVRKDLTTYLAQDPDLMEFGQLWWKATVLRDDILVVTAHHALFDYWSNAFIPQDVTDILTGAAPIQRTPFNRYVNYIQGLDEKTMEDFWRQYLEGASPSKLGSNEGPENTVSAHIDADLKKTATALKVTPGVLLYTAWALALADACAIDDVVFGITLSGRDAPVSGVTTMSGPTLMMAPMRVHLNRELSMDIIANEVQANLWQVARHAIYGMRNIMKASKQPKDLFDTAVNFLIKAPQPAKQEGLVLLPEASLEHNTEVKLELNNQTLHDVVLSSTLLSGKAQGLVDAVAHNLDHFTDSVPEELKARLKELTEDLTSTASSASSDIFDSEDGSKYETVATSRAGSINGEDWEDLAKAPQPETDYELTHKEIERMATVYPDNIAIQEASGNSITYADLAVKTNKLGNLLRSKGVRAEQVIPVMIDKSISTAIVMLGVMASGGAFVTLDGHNPRDRNTGIIEDVGTKLAITDKSNKAFFEGADYDVIVADELDWDSLPAEKCSAPEVTADSLAYIIYTSGSTGKPKGTLLPHRGLAAATQGIVDSTNVTSDSRTLWALNYVFDGSFHAFFSVLSVGGTICLAPQDTMTANLADLINSMKCTEASITPSMASIFQPEEVPTLKVLALGGEPVQPFIMDVWSPVTTVYSLYGPTEATIAVSGITVTPDHNLRNVGRAFKTVTAMILHPETAEPIQPGEVGELCVAGPQLARGYLNRPEATAKVFRTQPDGTQIYLTGDLARWLPNGEIELFGRKDDQIKLNGYRIELGEIESCLMQLDEFSTCVVVVGEVMKRKQLVAFCLSADRPADESRLLLPAEESPDWKAVAEKLTTLSSYMIPTVWFPVSYMPLSVSGKANKKELLAFVENMDDSTLKQYLGESEVVEISTDAERTLQSLWATTLNFPIEGIHAMSTFHGIGGDSISAINLSSAARKQGFQITVAEILANPSLNEQALLLKQNPASHVEVAAYEPPAEIHEKLAELNISEDDVEDIYPCAPGQLEFLTQGNKKDQFWQLYTVRTLPAGFDFERWIELTTKLTKNNDILRAFYVYADEEDPLSAVQVVLKEPVLNINYRTYTTEEERQQILDADWEARFEAGKPFVRYTVLDHAENGTRDLAIKLDHATYDGSLLYIFDDQFVAMSKGETVPEQTPYREFINHVHATPKQPQLDYWSKVMEDYEFDYLSNIEQPKITAGLNGKVPAEHGVDALAEACGVTAPIVFQTAYTLLLAHLSESSDVIYDNLISGRNVPIDNPQLINGTCANFLPFRGQIEDDTTVKTILSKTQADFWEASENGLVSLTEVYDELGRERSEGAKCLFCFQPFEPAGGEQDPMRWLVMKMNKNKMFFNYAIQLEIRKTMNKGEYVVQFTFDENAFTKEEAQTHLDWYRNCLAQMAQAPEGIVKALIGI